MPGAGSFPNCLSSPQGGGEPAARRMRPNRQADVMDMGQGTLDLDREDSDFRNRYAAQPAPCPETQPPDISRPGDFEAAMRNPRGGCPAYQILFPLGVPTRHQRHPIPRPIFEGVHSNIALVREEHRAGSAVDGFGH